jgi:hypothetical protein
MTSAITRAQVYEALSKSNCFIPDFRTQEKTILTWSKVYISIQEGKLRFVELNFLQRIIRYLSIWYADTIFTDKSVVERVKEYIHAIKTAPAYHDPIAVELLPKAQTTSDYKCLENMFKACEMIPDNSQEVIEDLEVLQRQVTELSKKSQGDGFSKDFLSAAIALAREKLKKNSDDKLWQSITEVFLNTLGIKAASNSETLLREVLGLPKEVEFPSRQIRVPDEITNAFKEVIHKANTALGIDYAATVESLLKGYGELEKIHKKLDNLPEVLRPFLAKESGRRMVFDLRDSLTSVRALPSIVKAYLYDEQQICNRLYYHANLDFSARPSPDFCKQVKEIMEECKTKTEAELKFYYEAVDLGPQRDFFSASCNRYQTLTGMTWREKIADELFKDVEYKTLAGDRIKGKEVTLEQYSKWIRNPLSPIGLPELKMLSKLTGRPVLIVKWKDDYFNWINGINLDGDQKPIILSKKNGIWRPVEKLHLNIDLIGEISLLS